LSCLVMSGRVPSGLVLSGLVVKSHPQGSWRLECESEPERRSGSGKVKIRFRLTSEVNHAPRNTSIGFSGLFHSDRIASSYMPRFTRIRWTIQQAAPEFDIHSATLAKRIKTLGVEPGEDKKFSTKQICDAVFGNLDGEKLAKIKAERELLEIELAKERKKLIESDVAFRVWEGVVVSIRQIIKSSALSDTEKNSILQNLREIDVEKIITERKSPSQDDT